MMGVKDRHFTPVHDLTLEEFVPENHPYRRLEAGIDLSFVRELAAPLYAGGGRTSVNPVVFFKLQLVVFFEALRSGGNSCGWWPTGSTRSCRPGPISAGSTCLTNRRPAEAS